VHHTSHSPPTSSHISIHTQGMTTVLPQIQYACSSCNEIFANTDTLRQHLLHQHQILIPFSPPSEPQYQVQIPQTSIAQTTTIQPEALQYTFTHPHKKYFDSEFPCLLCGVVSKNQDDLIKHMIRHTSTASTSQMSTIVERERVIDVSSTPTDLSNTTQYK
jgi:Zinc finger, C2H2 type